MPYRNVTAFESRRGTVTIVAVTGYGRERLRVFRAGVASIEQAYVWLRAHAPWGWTWQHPDGRRVMIPYDGILVRYAPVYCDRRHDVALALANSV